jgi:hypothetical protein
MSYASLTVVTLRANVPAVAAGTTTETVIGSVPYRSQVTAVRFLPVAAITGVNTNTRRVEVWNRGQVGAWTQIVASKQFDSGVNAAALTDTPVAVSLPLAEDGDTVTFRSIAVGTGLADPGGVVEVDVALRAA